MSLIYVVEDNHHLLNDTVEWINNNGHSCYGAPDAESFDVLMKNKEASLVVLDWMLPSEDGLAIAQRLRDNEQTKNIGIIFLTARSDIDDRIIGHNVADAYIVKPVNYKELSAIINSVLRRVDLESKYNDISTWQLSSKEQLIYSPCGQSISLSSRECAILLFLAQQPNAQASPENLIKAIGENFIHYEKNRLEMLLSRLRSKLKLNSTNNINPIRADRNKGYRLMLPIIITV